MITIGEVVEKVEVYNPSAIPKLMRAYDFAADHHKTQTRESGEPYITHPLRVVSIGTERFADEATLCAEMLHDTVEDCGVTYEELAELFGHEVATLVSYVTNLPRKNYPNKQEFIYANERRLIDITLKDVRAPWIKLDDRLDNMRTLEFKSEESRIAKAKDTLNFYVPLAYEFGEQIMANDLEDLSFQYINPEKYKEYSEIRNSIDQERDSCIKEMLYQINVMLKQEGVVNAELTSRILNTYGIYKKVIQGNKRLYGIDDLFAIKVITKEIRECYLALMVVHKAYDILQGNMKDYNFQPRRNQYKSLHTAILPPDGKGSIKVLIRTKEEEGIASYGLSYLWHIYEEEARDKMQREFNGKYSLCRKISEINPENGNAEYIERLTEEMANNKINVYTMSGEIFEIQEGATVVDFAYGLHTEIGDNISGALVNGSPVPFNYVLRWNDRVEIITGGEEVSREDWETFVVTHKAKERIKTYKQRKKEEKK
jgi:GTP pyrophosphokinase